MVWTYAMLSSSTLAANPIVGLVIKTETNPFSVTMKSAAIDLADELGVELHTFAGTYDGDIKTQIEAIETLIDNAAAGILVTP